MKTELTPDNVIVTLSYEEYKIFRKALIYQADKSEVSKKMLKSLPGFELKGNKK